ncbi:hypothetical protein NN561_010688 [Cricetulus griseus]
MQYSIMNIIIYGTFKIPNEGHISHFQGKYRCFASNRLGTAISEEIEFIVPGVPKFPKEKIEPMDVEEGDSIVLPCNPPKGLPPLHIYWMNIEPPRWKKKPQSAVYSTGSSGILLCEAEGEPQPTIKWRVNGFPIENHPFPGDVMFTREISFTNLQPNHTAVYQCEASNIHGTILASANIDVVDVVPLIKTKNEENYATVLGYSAFLHCEYFASPKATVIWEVADEAHPLEGSRYHTHENGTLEIYRTTEEDAGSYSCWVDNAMGKAVITANLDIRNATKLKVSPKNPRIPKSHMLELHCESQCDSHLKHTLKLSWSKDGETFDINGTEDGRIVIDGANLTISNISVEDQGIYSCSAQTALDSISEKTQVTVLEYIIEFEGNREEPGKWQELTRIPGEETEAVLSLAPYVRYQFRVIAVNEVGRSYPSQPSDHHETPPAAPDKNPQNIRVQASQPKEMIIKWEPLKSMEQNGPGLEYRVSWKPQGAPEEWEEETVTNHTLRVMTPTVYAPYDVQVQAINQLGSGPEPQPVTLYSGEDYPSTAPVIHGVDVMNSTLVKVTWSSIPKETVHGLLRGYQINWWKTKSLLDGRTHPKEVNILRFSGQRNSGMVPSLDAFSEYHLTVLAYNSKGAGPESEAYIFQTPEGVNDTYEIGELNEINVTTPSKSSWHLSNLNATTKYKFYLKACTSKGCGKPISEESATLGEGIKEKEDLHPDPEVQSAKDETFGEYSDSDEKPLKGSLRSLNRNMQPTESADSLVEYGEGDHSIFNEDGSFIGAYTGAKEKGSVESNGSSTATFPLRA